MKYTTLPLINNLSPLIDCDPLIYRCGFAADSQARKELTPEGLDKEVQNDLLHKEDYLHWALGNAKHIMEKLLHQIFTNHARYSLYISGKYNFREQIATLLPYKGNRDALHKPKYYAEIKDYMREVWGGVDVDGMEADDALAIEQFSNKDKSTCIVSVDKDLLTCVGYNYCPVRDRFCYVTMADAYYNFFTQMLEGDASDNIPGIKGVGPKTAAKILDKHASNANELYQAVMIQYKKQYGAGWVGAFNEVATLLWIIREENVPCPFLVSG